MAAVLDRLKPLAALIAQAEDPPAVAADVLTAARARVSADAVVAVVAAAVSDSAMAVHALEYAGVLQAHGPGQLLAADAVFAAGQVQVLVEAQAAGRWDLVLTVPPFLQRSFQGLIAEHGRSARHRQTSAVLREVTSAAQRRLVIAAPFLDEVTARELEPDVARLVAAGGEVVVLTRALSAAKQSRSKANVAAVNRLRLAGARDEPGLGAGGVRVVSWEESGLGLHFKVVLADDRLAYVGSANLTGPGSAAHAEAGVLLRGEGVDGLARWLDAVCAELSRRRRVSGP